MLWWSPRFEFQWFAQWTTGLHSQALVKMCGAAKSPFTPAQEWVVWQKGFSQIQVSVSSYCPSALIQQQGYTAQHMTATWQVQKTTRNASQTSLQFQHSFFDKISTKAEMIVCFIMLSEFKSACWLWLMKLRKLWSTCMKWEVNVSNVCCKHAGFTRLIAVWSFKPLDSCVCGGSRSISDRQRGWYEPTGLSYSHKQKARTQDTSVATQ